MKRIGISKGYFFVAPGVLGITIFYLIPMCEVLFRSFVSTTRNGSISLDNYVIVFQNEAFQLAVVNTAKFSIICIPLLLILSFLIACFMQMVGKNSKIWKKILLLPMSVPVVALAILCQVIFSEYGFANFLLKLIGKSSINWLHSANALLVLVFIYLWKNIGYTCILWLAGMAQIDEEVYEAAKVDGATRSQSILNITIPLLKPYFFIILIISFIRSFQIFREAYLIAGEYPDESIYTIQHLLNNWYRDMYFERISVVSVIVLLLVICLTLIWKKQQE